MQTVTYQSRVDHCVFFLKALPYNKDHKDDKEANEQPDNNATVPGVRLATILEGQNIRNYQAHHENCSGKVHLQQLLLQWDLHWHSFGRGVEEEEDNHGSYSSNGKIDVEALQTRQ
jgi:hypothetical protein